MPKRLRREHRPERGGIARAWNRCLDRSFQTSCTPLMEAARNGNRYAIERRIAAGDALDERDARGRTALHHALLGEHPENAACLLANGADPGALGLAHASLPLLHEVRQRYRRFRPFPGEILPECTERAAVILKDLETEGITRVSGLVGARELERMRVSCQAFVDNIDRALAAGRGVKQHYDEEEHWWPKDVAYVTNNAFKYSDDLLELCADPLLVAIVNHYLGGGVFVERGVGMRYLPDEPSERDMFGWHHDMEERRLKAMVLLTDVGESDQPMSYACGTQVICHPYEMFFLNHCPLDYSRAQVGEPRIFQATGSAGDVILFDSNGAHRGNRRTEGSVRDAFFVEYTTDPSNVWGGNLDADFLAERPAAAALFGRMRATQKTWERPRIRRAPTWVENLPYPERWLRPSAGRSRSV